MPCRALLDRVAEAYTAADLVALSGLYAEDALICSAAAPDLVWGRDDLFSQGDLLSRTHLIGGMELIPIDERAGLIRAIARTQTPEGGYESAERVWLITFKAGLIFRQRVLDSRDEAIELYVHHGLDLGMEGVGSSL